jgi:hypothetical protein
MEASLPGGRGYAARVPCRSSIATLVSTPDVAQVVLRQLADTINSLGAARVRHVLELRSRELMEPPPLGAMLAGGARPIDHPALAAIEARYVATRERHPIDAVGADVAASRPEAGERRLVDLGEARVRRIGPRRKPDDGAGIAEHRAPDRAVGRADRDGVVVDLDPLVLGRIDRLGRLDIIVALAVAVGVEDERRGAACTFGESPSP